MSNAGLQYLLVLGFVAAGPSQFRGNVSKTAVVNELKGKELHDPDHHDKLMYCELFMVNRSSRQQQPQVLEDAQLAIERLQMSRNTLRAAFETLEQGRQHAKQLSKLKGMKMESHEAAQKDLSQAEDKLEAFSQTVVSLQDKITAEETVVSKAQEELCERRATLVAQKKVIEEKEKEIAAKQKGLDNAWEDFEHSVWGAESSQAKLKELQKQNQASQEDLNRTQAAVASKSVELEKRKEKLEQGRRLIASARGEMNALKGAVEWEEQTVAKEEVALKKLNGALSQQKETNQAYQDALTEAQAELHVSYHNAVSKQGAALDHLTRVHYGIADTMGLQDEALKSVQDAISETKRALAYCNDRALKDYLDRRANFQKNISNFNSTIKDLQQEQPSPAPTQNPNEAMANLLKEKIDALMKALPKDF